MTDDCKTAGISKLRDMLLSKRSTRLSKLKYEDVVDDEVSPKKAKPAKPPELESDSDESAEVDDQEAAGDLKAKVKAQLDRLVLKKRK